LQNNWDCGILAEDSRGASALRFRIIGTLLLRPRGGTGDARSRASGDAHPSTGHSERMIRPVQ